MQDASQARPADDSRPQKRQPHTGHTAGTLRCRSEQRVQVPQGYGQDTCSGASHGQEHHKKDNSVRDCGGTQEYCTGA